MTLTKPISFDYASLDSESRIVIQQRTGEIRDAMRKTTEGVIAVGQKLTDVKARLEHGQFGIWLDFEFGWSHQTATTYMQIAELFAEKSDYLIFGPTVLGLLAKPSTPESARTEIIERAKNGDKITVDGTKATIEEHKKPVTTPPHVSIPAKPAETPRYVNDGDAPALDDVPVLNRDEDAYNVHVAPAVARPGVPLTRPNGEVKPIGSQPPNPVPGGQIATSSISGTAPTGGQPPYVPGQGDIPWRAWQIPGTDCYDVQDAHYNTIYPMAGLPKALAFKIVMGVNFSGNKMIVNEPTPEELGEKLGIDGADIVEAMSEYGLKPVMKALEFLLTLENRPKNGYMALIQTLNLWKNLNGDVKTKPEKKSKEPKEKKAPNENAAQITEILATYLQYSGVIDAEIYAKLPQRIKAERLIKAHVCPEHIKAYIQGLRTEKFWKDKAITLDKILLEIVPWLNAHMAGWNKPAAAETATPIEFTGELVPLDQAWRTPA